MCFNLVAELWLLLLLSVVALVTFVVVFAPTSVETAIKDAVNSGRDEMCVQFPMLCRRTTSSTTLAISTANSFGADNSQFGEPLSEPCWQHRQTRQKSDAWWSS